MVFFLIFSLQLEQPLPQFFIYYTLYFIVGEKAFYKLGINLVIIFVTQHNTGNTPNTIFVSNIMQGVFWCWLLVNLSEKINRQKTS